MSRSQRIPLLVVCLLAAAGLLLFGCSDSDSPTDPARPGVDLAPAALDLGITATYAFDPSLTDVAAGDLVWTVDGVTGGDAARGTITQGDPATYTAPDVVPDPAVVLVKVVSSANPALADSCEVTIVRGDIHVNAGTGDDATGVGGVNKPFATITHALTVAVADDRVLVAPGLYDRDLGEDFPMTIPDSVTVEGLEPETTILRVPTESNDVTTGISMSCTDCALRKITVEEEAGLAEPYWRIAVHVNYCTGALVDSVRVDGRARYSALRLDHDHGSTISNCRFVVDDGVREDRGLEIVFNEDGNGSVLRGLVVSGFHTGLFFNYPQDTLVEGCVLSGNTIGAELCCYQDANSQPNPDLGGGSHGGQGGNDFSGNASVGLSNLTANTILAVGNTWDNDPPVEGDDYTNADAAGGGEVITEAPLPIIYGR